MTADNISNTQPRLLDPHLAIRPDRRLIRANGRSERFLKIRETIEVAVRIRAQVLRVENHFPDVTHLVAI